ncbi:PREDICTED: cytochrome P450 6a9-like [Rhagoletis zephyria]|uniref:cytochrome P450 6a9-like n=1 Tax=Rhagoletis zephyria TaxID=28612 RepID=UPI000811AA14|nr:PREDICTED: cytochrome P450 6a9-like [Rhagoletis zephyria]
MSVFAVLLAALLALLSFLFYLLRRRMNYWRYQGIPHDRPHFFAGNLKGLLKTRNFAEILLELYTRHKGTGPFCGYYLFQRPAVLVLDRALVKSILIKDFNNFADRGLFHNEKDDPLTGHLFRLDGNQWRGLRSKLTPTFTSGKMKFMFPTVLKVGDQLMAAVAKRFAEDEHVWDWKEMMACFTTDVIGNCAFGIECNSLQDPHAEFRVMGRKIIGARRHGALVNAFINSFPNVARRLRMAIMPQDITDFFLRIVHENVEFRERNRVHANDFMSILMDLNKGKHLKSESDVACALSVSEMTAQAFVFFVAGFETSATTLAFALYELALHPDIQTQLRTEIEETIRKHNNEFTYECVEDMQYMKQVLAETQRKYPIAPNLMRQAAKDYVVAGHPKYVIKKGMMVTIPTIGIHYDPEIYPDPDKFDPSRFAPDAVKLRDSVDWLPFGDGPRNCIGMRFGQMQMRIGLTYLLRQLKFSPCERTPIPIVYQKSFPLFPQGGIFLRVEKV